MLAFAAGHGRYAGVVIHNASNASHGVADITAIARNPDGSLLAIADTSILAPYLLDADHYSIGLVRLDTDLPADTGFTFAVHTETPNDDFLPIVDLLITDASIEDENVNGCVENTTAFTASTLVAVVGIFPTADGAICGWFPTYLAESLAPGSVGTFEVYELHGSTSSSFARAASGWAESWTQG